MSLNPCLRAAAARVDLHGPADNAQALAHADQTEAVFALANRNRRWVEARAIVAYATTNRIGFSFKSNPHRSCPGVLDHIVQRFLGNVVQGRFDPSW
jgi:hypothetical protein